MQCPYCGQEMQQGILSGDGRANVCWKAGEKKAGWFESAMGTGKLTAVKYTPASFRIEAHFCSRCRKMILETDVRE